MNFANWTISDEGISYSGDAGKKYLIPAQELTKTTTSADGVVIYQWIMDATEQEWLTENDLYDLNYAFIYAAAKSSDFEYSIFDDTLAEQFDQFESEEE